MRGKDKKLEDTGIPVPPEEAVTALWGAAWTAVETVSLKHANSLNEDRDQLRDALQVATDDGAALVDEVARLEADVEEKVAQMDAQAALASEAAGFMQRRSQRSQRGWMRLTRRING